ncbi:Uncharacterised protein [Mycobacteroides abscessus subsp. bolletii]|uniref:toll/interleukin-1 receptor domain-containing protein n=1 Tax=Mycobacteroides abscessus TaxID=36809 RepID=UPI00092A8AA1|nr:toll/interleukin-1 receptor domain-containing protein [Mycobacteroides abscessus]SHZ34543.1 Uncharacterised protein [Mycobacteroides abscessus subsp. bolletii]SKP93480.1 Uncharacterised protein [Mycobacteroides abscessus subsp. bolletii]SKQ78809.1 Uncharacterised protein [Mycobacteroides abscessus subsp. bolletii]SKQ83005.1 Uncharacterised protein [Mycobacteroides abscessus subsp. bolletii]
MAIERDLSIFISWSGTLARECTKVLREWLPRMFDHVDPWASDTDIEAGDRSMDEIQTRLNESGFGIIVVTTENAAKPWLNFEAGALSKSFNDVKNRVVPLLVNFNDLYSLKGPISQFHAVLLDKDGASRLCDSIGGTIGLDKQAVRARFEWAWPSLETGIAQAKLIAGEQPEAPPVNEKDLLKDVLSIVRSLQENQIRLESRVRRPYPIHRGADVQRAYAGNDSVAPLALSTIVREAAMNYASEIKPVRNVRIRRPVGDVPEVVITFEDGQGLTDEEFSRLSTHLAKHSNYGVVIQYNSNDD